MKSNILLSTVCLGAFLSFGSVRCPAQSANQDQGTPVTLKIDIVAWGPEIPGLTLGPGKKKDTLTALPFRYSKAVLYAGSNILEIHQSEEALAKAKEADQQAENQFAKEEGIGAPPPPPLTVASASAGKPEDKSDPVVASVILPVNSKWVTILLAPGKSKTYQAYVIDDDPSKLPYGRLRIHNLSQLVVALRCNDKKPSEINPKGFITVAPEKNHIIYELAYKLNGAWRMQENNLLKVNDNEQAQMIILNSNDSHFVSSDGSKGGFMQMVVLRRIKEVEPPPGSPAARGASSVR